MAQFEEDDPELETESFSAPLFLQRELLSDKNVLEYFYESKFFDTNSANQRRRKGQRVSEQGEGVEYVLMLSNAAGKGQLVQPLGYPFNVQNQFGVHVISRVNKHNDVQIPERVYYSISGTIYQAPSFQKLVLSKLYRASQILEEMIKALTSMCHWNVLSSYNWKAPLDVETILKDINGDGLTDAKRGDCFEDDLLISSDEDEADSPTAAATAAEASPSGRGAAPGLTLPQILPDESEFDEPGSRIPLSARGRRKVGLVIYNFPQSHAANVLQSEYDQLFKASRRMANVFVNEATERPRIEGARRDVFVKYHQALDGLEASLLASYKARNIPTSPKPFFGCNPPTQV